MSGLSTVARLSSASAARARSSTTIEHLVSGHVHRLARRGRLEGSFVTGRRPATVSSGLEGSWTLKPTQWVDGCYDLSLADLSVLGGCAAVEATPGVVFRACP